MGLTFQQTRFFRDTGYLRLPGRIEDDLVSQLATFLSRQGATAEKLYGLQQLAPGLVDRLVRHEVILDPLRSLLGEHIVFLTNRHNCGILHPGISEDSLRLHRDILQWSRPVVTILVYLDPSRVDNGCTHVIPGSHQLPFVSNGERTGGTWMDEHEEYSDLLDQAVPVPMSRGAILALDATVFHAAGNNTSRDPRMTIALAYRSVDELDAQPDRKRSILVSGEYLYRGNDRSHATANS